MNEEIIRKPKVILVGIGNELRSDDGIGKEFINNFSHDHIHKTWIRFLDFDVVELIKDYDIVFFIDASLRTDSFNLVKISELLPFNTFSHYPSYKTIFEFLRKNHGKDIEVYVLEVGAKNFDFGQNISEYARKNIQKANQFLKKFIDNIFYNKEGVG